MAHQTWASRFVPKERFLRVHGSVAGVSRVQVPGVTGTLPSLQAGTRHSEHAVLLRQGPAVGSLPRWH